MREGLSTDLLRLPLQSASYGATNSLNLVASASACSAAPCADKSVALMFMPPANTGFQLQGGEVILHIDGTQTVLRSAETEGARQNVRVVVDGFSFAKMATGRDVAVSLGATRLNLPASVLVELRALANRMGATF